MRGKEMTLIMNFMVNCGIFDGVFAVPNCVVDKHIKLAGAAQLKVLLYLLRHGGQNVNCDEMSARLGYSGADVRDAINYWSEVGMLAKPEVLPEPSTAAPREKPLPAPAENLAPDTTALRGEALRETGVVESGNIKKLTNTYRFTQKEAFTRMEGNEELRFLVEQCRILLGRELQGSDVAALVSIHDWVGLPPDVILMAADYCASKGRTDMRSVEKQCTAWVDLGIRTHEDADGYIKRQAERHSREALVQGSFGISGRSLSAREREAITRWFDEYGYELPVIRAAFDKTVDNTGKLSFAYLDRILSNWHDKGVKTLEEALSESQAKPAKAVASTSFNLELFENDSIYNTPKI